ncbi:MAG: chromosomal replication initiator DnaA [Roseovarius sp.]
MPRQLSFDLPVREALGRDDFFVSPANAAAVAMVEGWQGWPAGKLLLLGPEGAGKTHLAHVWAALSGAGIVAAASLATANIPALASGHVAVEDCAAVAGDTDAEKALFHLHNLTLAEGNALLLTASPPPRDWGLALPDLASRMQGTPSVSIAPPDDALLSAVLMKLFADRQLAPGPAVIPYLATRIDRSFASARAVVRALDTAALEKGRPITVKLAGQVLDKLAT